MTKERDSTSKTTPQLRKCCRCEGYIPDDEAYAVIGENVYCEACIDEIPYCELIPMLGGEWHEAGES